MCLPPECVKYIDALSKAARGCSHIILCKVHSADKRILEKAAQRKRVPLFHEKDP